MYTLPVSSFYFPVLYIFQADAIVNTTGNKLNLDDGAVSKAILADAGSSIQDEVNLAQPNGLNIGGVVSSHGGNLSCKTIYHTILPQWDRDNGKAQQVTIIK